MYSQLDENNLCPILFDDIFILIDELENRFRQLKIQTDEVKIDKLLVGTQEKIRHVLDYSSENREDFNSSISMFRIY